MPFPTANRTSYQVVTNVSTDPATQEPWIIPPEYGPGGVVTAGQVQVAVAGMKGPNWANGGLPAQYQNGDFTLAWSGDSATIQAQSDVWSTDATSRSNLAANFQKTGQGLELLEQQGVLSLGGAYAMSRRIAEALPLPYGEMFGYRYGFNPQQRYVDLIPGMRLRVEAAAGEFVSPGSASNGFVGSGTSTWLVTRRRTDQALMFDPFLGALAPYPPVASAGWWGLVDLAAAGTFRYYRLFYPPAQSALAPWPGSDSALENASLIGAGCLADLITATTAYTSGQPVPTPGACGPIGTTFFHGRAVLVPEVAVQVLVGSTFITDYAPVGTTLRNLTERYLPPAAAAGAATAYRVWSPRDIGNSMWVPITGAGVPLADGAFPAGIDAWDLPVVAGDRLTFQ